MYAVATIGVYLVSSPVGSNIARLGTFLALPLAALLWWPRRKGLLALAALTPVLLVVWAWVLDRGVTTPEGGGESARRRRPRSAATGAEAP